MSSKRIAGIVVAILGIVMIFVSSYIKREVAEGKLKITSAQKTVDRSSSILSSQPVTKPLGEMFTGSAQKKINEGKEQVNQYTQLADGLQIGGIAFIALGLLLIIFGKKKRPSHM